LAIVPTIRQAQAMRVKIRQFDAGLIARLVEALEAVPEGTGRSDG
jgi:hypothetical protein